jgi:hypothetical protein
MKKYRTIGLILVLAAMTLWGVILPASGQEKAKPEGSSKDLGSQEFKRIKRGLEGGD